MTMLPDVPEDQWRQYTADQFDQNTSGQIDQVGFSHAADSRIATLDLPPLAPPPPPEPPPVPPEEALRRLGTGFAPAPQPPPPDIPPPQPAPTPEPTPAPPPEQVQPPQPPVAAPAPEPNLVSSSMAALDNVRTSATQAFAQATNPAALPHNEEPGTASDIHGGRDLGNNWKTQFDFGATYTGDYRTGTPHRGVDIVPSNGQGIGTVVDAFEPGTVTNVFRDPGGAGGLIVYVQDADGLTHAYMHLNDANVKIGDQVQRGTPIATMGESGTEGSPHLHYEVRKNAATGDPLNALIDPRAYIAGTKQPGQPQVAMGQPITDVPTTAGISGGGPTAGQIGDRGSQILSGAADSAAWLGDQGQKALQAILVTEGGLNNARGDGGKSAGPLQFYEGGQLANFARDTGLTLDQAKTYVEQHPLEAVQWAIGTASDPGYLGLAIASGQAQGLSGAALATYAQRTGQVSDSPERAGQNFLNLFGQGQGVISGAGQALQGAQQKVGNVFSQAGSGAQQALQQIPVFAQNAASAVTGAASSMAPDQGSPLDRLKGAFSDFVDYLGGQASSAGQRASTFASDVGTTGGGAASSLGTAANDLGTQLTTNPSFVYQNAPGVKGFNEGLAALGPAVTGGRTFDLADVLAAPETGRMAAGRAIENLPTGDIPVLSGVANVGKQIVGGFLQQPSVLDSVKTIGDLVQKYPTMDANQMTPEDREAYNQAFVAIGGVTAGGGEPRPVPERTAAQRAQDLFRFNYGQADQLGADGLYHQTSVRNAMDLLWANQGGPGGEVYVSPYEDLALGQAGQGATVEYAPTNKLWVSADRSKPSSQFVEDARGLPPEMVIRRSDASGRDTIRSITIEPNAPMDRVARAQIKNLLGDWSQETLADGSIRYSNPRVAASETAAVAPALSETAPAEARVEPTTRPTAAAEPFATPPETTRTVTTPEATVTEARGGGGGAPPREPPAPPSPLPSESPPPRRRATPGYDGRVVASPELQRLEHMYEPTSAPRATDAGLKDRITGAITRQLFDRRVDINRAQEAYARQIRRPLRANEMAAELQRLAASPAAEQHIDERLKPAVQSVGRDYRALRSYVTLRSNIEVANALGNNARLFSGNLTAAESAKALRDLELELGPQRWARVQHAGDQISQFSNSLRQRLVDSGVLSADQAAEMEGKYPNWVKTRILDYMEREGPNSQGAGTRIGLSSRDVHAYTDAGTVRAREDPIASTVAYAHQVERMARKNEAFNAFLNMDQASPTPQLRRVTQDFMPTRDQTTVQGFVNGQKQRYVTDNKALGAAINGSGVMTTPEWTSAWQKVFRSLATSRNPLFLAGNAAIDMPTYVLRSTAREGGPQALPRVLSELVRGYADAFAGFDPGAIARGEFGPNTARFLKGGGGQSGFFTGGEGVSKQAVEELQRKHVFQINGPGDIGRLVKDLVTLKPVESLGERIELGPRVAAMRLAERRGANPVQAVIDGRNVTIDFSQGGIATKYLNNFIPFFNVGFQGPAQIVRAYRQNPRAFLATMGTLIGLPTTATEAWNRGYNPDGTHDEQRAKDYADVPDYVKNQGVVVMLPGQAGTDAQGNRKPLYAVVKLREFAPFAALAREATDRALGDDSHSWTQVAQSMGTGLSPTNATSLAQVGTEPLAGIPLLPGLAQLGMNQDWFRGRTIVSQRADDNASALAKGLTPVLQRMTDATGVNAEVRPSAVDFLIRNQGAGVGDALLGASNLATGYSPPSRGGPTDIPVVGGLAGRFVGSQTGQGMETALGEALTPSSRQILRDNGITSTPGPVSSSVNQIPLLRDEQTRYQQLANRYIDDAIHRAVQSSDWTTLTDRGKQSRMQEMIDGARAKAGNEVLSTIAASEKQRRLHARATGAAA